MKTKNVSLIIFLVILLALTSTSYAFADRLNGLIESPNFADDARLSHIVYEYFLTEQKAMIKVDVSSNQHRKEGYNVANNANLWSEHVKPLCERLTNKYEAAKNANINALKNRPDQVAFAAASDRFAQRFETSVFRVCREYQERVDALNTSDVGLAFHVPRVLRSYADGLAKTKSGSNRTLARAIKDQTAGPYGVRVSQTDDIKILLDWIEVIGTDKPKFAQWRASYEKTRAGWEQLIADNRDNQEIRYQSSIASDAYDHTDGDAIRSKIGDALGKAYSAKPKKIILRNNSKRTALRRLVIKNGRLVGEKYTAMGFYAVIDQGNQQLSTHRGWYELLDGASTPNAFIYKEDQNFKKPRVDQIVSALQKPSQEEIRKHNSGQVAEQNARESAELEKQNRVNTNAAVNAAHEEAARLKAQAQAQSNSALRTAKTTDKPKGFNLVSAVFAGLLLIGGILVNLSKISETRFADSAKKVNELFQSTPLYLNIYGGCLGLLGVINILFSTANLSLFGITSGVIAVLVGGLMNHDELLSKFEYLESHLRKLDSFRFALGTAAVLFGFTTLIMQS